MGLVTALSPFGGVMERKSMGSICSRGLRNASDQRQGVLSRCFAAGGPLPLWKCSSSTGLFSPWSGIRPLALKSPPASNGPSPVKRTPDPPIMALPHTLTLDRIDRFRFRHSFDRTGPVLERFAFTVGRTSRIVIVCPHLEPVLSSP